MENWCAWWRLSHFCIHVGTSSYCILVYWLVWQPVPQGTIYLIELDTLVQIEMFRGKLMRLMEIITLLYICWYIFILHFSILTSLAACASRHHIFDSAWHIGSNWDVAWKIDALDGDHHTFVYMVGIFGYCILVYWLFWQPALHGTLYLIELDTLVQIMMFRGKLIGSMEIITLLYICLVYLDTAF